MFTCKIVFFSFLKRNDKIAKGDEFDFHKKQEILTETDTEAKKRPNIIDNGKIKMNAYLS